MKKLIALLSVLLLCAHELSAHGGGGWGAAGVTAAVLIPTIAIAASRDRTPRYIYVDEAGNPVSYDNDYDDDMDPDDSFRELDDPEEGY